MDASSVDLIYADPPFGTGKDWGDFDDRWDSMQDFVGWLRERMVQCRRILKPTGSIYLHCDPTASHYIKVMMDGVFGKGEFQE